MYFNCIVNKPSNLDGFVLWYMFSLKWPDNLNTSVMDKLIYLLVVFIWLWSEFIPVLKDEKKNGTYLWLFRIWTAITPVISLSTCKTPPGLYFPALPSAQRSLLYGVFVGRLLPSPTCFFFQLSKMHDSLVSRLPSHHSWYRPGCWYRPIQNPCIYW